MESILKLTGRISAKVFDSSGNLLQESENHNIITKEGDAYIADLLSLNPTRTKFSSDNCFISVGTGWTGTNTKQNDWVNTQVGNSNAIDATFPKVKGAWGELNDNVLQFQSTFAIGSLNANGINEVCLSTHSTDSSANSTLAYAQINPPVNVSSSDLLIITWEITFLGGV